MSADLSGPHPEAVGAKPKYMLAAVANAGPGKRKPPMCKRVTSNTAKEVPAAMFSVLGELNSILGDQPVVGLHTDAGQDV